MSDKIKVIFDSDSRNESFARVVVAAFLTRVDPTVEELSDVKTAVSEAVTNCIVHAYRDCSGQIELKAELSEKTVTITVRDEGVGIADIQAAREPLFTTKPEQERSGMGFSFMEIFMDSLEVESQEGVGTTVIMSKRLGAE